MISIRDIANRELLDLVPYEPGKPVEDVARELGLDPASIIKLASNENPLGPSPKAIAAMHAEVEKVHFYPDGGGFHLRNAIAEKFDLKRENVVLGNGSNEIIELLFHTFTRPGVHEIVNSRHAFAVYTLMAQLFGVRTIMVDDVDFTPDLQAMRRAITPQTRLIFLASPNNPTGTRVSNEALDAFLADLPPHVVTVLDEAYCEFIDDAPDTISRVRNGERVVLMRTFSKIYGPGRPAHRLRARPGRHRRPAAARTPALQRQLHRPGRRHRRAQRHRASAPHQGSHGRRPGRCRNRLPGNGP